MCYTKGEIFINALENSLINITNDKYQGEFQKPKAKNSDFKNYFNDYKKVEEKPVNKNYMKKIDRNPKFVSNDTEVVNKELEKPVLKEVITTQVENIKDTEEIKTEDELKLLEEEMLLELSKIMGMPVNEIKSKLDDMNITVFDLDKHENLIEFTKEVKQIDSDFKLLDKEIKTLIKDVKTLMDTKKDKISNQDIQKQLIIKNNIIKIKSTNDENKENNTDISIIEDVAIEDQVLNKYFNVINEDDSAPVDVPLDMETVLTEQLVKVDVSQQMKNSDNKFDFNESFNEKFNQDFITKNLQMTNNNQEISFQNVIETKTEVVKPYIEPREVLNQIVSNIKVDSSEKMSTIKMTLHPESLGDVTLKIATQNGIVTAQFVAENERVKAIIEAGFNNLKDILSEQGVNINSLSVSVGSEKNNQGGEFNQSHNSRHDIKIEGFMETTEVTSKYDINDPETTVNYMV